MSQDKTGRRHRAPCPYVEVPCDHQGQPGQGIPSEGVWAGLEEGYLVQCTCQGEGRHIPKVADAQTMSRRRPFHFVGWIQSTENKQDFPVGLADFDPT